MTSSPPTISRTGSAYLASPETIGLLAELRPTLWLELVLVVGAADDDVDVVGDAELLWCLEFPVWSSTSCAAFSVCAFIVAVSGR